MIFNCKKFLLILFIVGYGMLIRAEENTFLPKKVALLFLTCGDLNHTDFWKNYLSPHLDKFTIYIHSKHGVNDPFFAQFTLSKTVHTSWGNTIRAERALLRQAFKDQHNYKFILLSESCIPLVTADILYQTLVKDEWSYFFWTHEGWWPPKSSRELVELPKEHRKGNHTWIMLNRRHAEVCIKDKSILKIAEKHANNDESYFASLFSFHHCLEEVVNFGYTFADWGRPAAGGAHPYTFTFFNGHDFTVLKEARAKGHLIARKFSLDYPTEAIQALIDSEY